MVEMLTVNENESTHRQKHPSAEHVRSHASADGEEYPHNNTTLMQDSRSACRIQRIPLTGGAEGIRTPDLFNAIEALSQLSYSPTDLSLSLTPDGVSG